MGDPTSTTGDPAPTVAIPHRVREFATAVQTHLSCHVLGDSKQCGNLRDAIEAGYKAACEL